VAQPIVFGTMQVYGSSNTGPATSLVCTSQPAPIELEEAQLIALILGGLFSVRG
jgi:hypothetical protein